MPASATLTFDTASSVAEAGGTEVWQGPSNALLSDESDAVINFSTAPAEKSELLKVTGIVERDVPPEAKILGIQINYEWQSTVGVVSCNGVQLEENGTRSVGSVDFGTGSALPSSEATESFPSTTNEKWSAPFHTFSDMVARGFGAGVQTIYDSGAVGTQSRVDQVTATVHYTVPCRNRPGFCGRGMRRYQNGYR